MSEFTIGGYEELRSFEEIVDDLRDRAGEMLGRTVTRMGFGETAIACQTDNSEEDTPKAEMADEDKKEPEVVVEDKQVGDVTVHTEFLKPGTAGPGTGEGAPVQKDQK